MDFVSIIGMVFGLGCILVAQALEGGNVQSLIQLTAFLIVAGGTVGAVVASFPLDVLISGMEMCKKSFAADNIDFNKIIQEILGYATKARKEGVIILEKEAKNASDPLLTVGLEAVSDGADPVLVRDLMETRLSQLEDKVMKAAKVWEAGGGYSPTFGIIGAVMGLIQVMQNLSDPSKLGAGIAVAFVATIYGLIMANLIFLPLATKIKFKSAKEFLAKQIMIEGILSIQAGESPALIERKLQAFLMDKKAAAQAAAKPATVKA
ncbi:MAG: flagellar motor protein [Candidatus Gastranaerophilales bacterium]|nr:flagellar motor protein [Candidatus Gastranaerophilales bacterium]